MVSFIRVFSRVCHVVGAMSFLALQFHSLLRTTPASESPSITLDPLPAFGITTPITVNSIMVTEIISTIVLLAGGLNAALLKPRVNMANTPKQARNWRLTIYGLKVVLFLLATPMAKMVVKNSGLVLQAVPATAANTLEIERTAAAIRIAAIVASSVVGAYARFSSGISSSVSDLLLKLGLVYCPDKHRALLGVGGTFGSTVYRVYARTALIPPPPPSRTF